MKTTRKSHALICTALLVSISASLHGQESNDRFKQWDKNNDGKLTKDELDQQAPGRFERLDADHDGVVTRAEQDAFLKPRGNASAAQRGRARPNGEYYAPPAMAERVDSPLKIGDVAPGFSLQPSGGGEAVTLAQFKGKKPVVLVFGSITCGPFRKSVVETFDLHKKYADKAEFLMIYIREAHPESTILVEENGVSSLKEFLQTDTFKGRVGNAQSCEALLKVPFPMLIDAEDNATLAAYGAWPIRLVVVGKDGRIAWDSGEGPRGFRPDKLEQWLRENL